MTELIRASHGVWQPSEALVELRDRCAVLLGALPEGAIVSGRTAARLHRLWVPQFAQDYVEVVLTRPDDRPREYAHSRRDEVRTRRRTLGPLDVTEVGGIPVTTEERTWVDLATELTLPDLVACGDSVLCGTGPRVSLVDVVRAARGQRGVRRARTALDLVDGDSRSRPESLIRVAFVLGGLPKPHVNKPVYGRQHEWLYEPDLHYKEAMLSFDYQGEDHAEKARMRRDITRGLDVVVQDWQNVYLGPAEVFGRPWTLAPIAKSLIERRAPGFLREWRESQRVAREYAPLDGSTRHSR